jgi:hypothetical protein
MSSYSTVGLERLGEKKITNTIPENNLAFISFEAKIWYLQNVAFSSASD